jgi:hypothetical protein
LTKADGEITSDGQWHCFLTQPGNHNEKKNKPFDIIYFLSKPDFISAAFVINTSATRNRSSIF